MKGVQSDHHLRGEGSTDMQCVNDTALFQSIGHPVGNRTRTKTAARLVWTHVTGKETC